MAKVKRLGGGVASSEAGVTRGTVSMTESRGSPPLKPRPCSVGTHALARSSQTAHSRRHSRPSWPRRSSASFGHQLPVGYSHIGGSALCRACSIVDELPSVLELITQQKTVALISGALQSLRLRTTDKLAATPAPAARECAVCCNASGLLTRYPWEPSESSRSHQSFSITVTWSW